MVTEFFSPTALGHMARGGILGTQSILILGDRRTILGTESILGLRSVSFLFSFFGTENGDKVERRTKAEWNGCLASFLQK